MSLLSSHASGSQRSQTGNPRVPPSPQDAASSTAADKAAEASGEKSGGSLADAGTSGRSPLASRSASIALVTLWGCAIVVSTWFPVREMWPGSVRSRQKSSDGPTPSIQGSAPPPSKGTDNAALAPSESNPRRDSESRKPASSDELRLTSEPPASVFVDGKPLGQTPLNQRLSPGPHELLLIANGYRIVRRDITTTDALSIKLEPAELPNEVSGPNAINITCKTAGALRILVDGHDTGSTCPTDNLMLSAGNHTFGFLEPVSRVQNDVKKSVKKSKSPQKLKVKF